MNDLIQQAESLFKGNEDNISLLANASAFLNEILSDINWVGFYLVKDNKLHLGPFQGKVACTPIEFTNGVCGHAYTTKQIVNVDNVNEFKGHIVCDENSKSELVVPLIKNNIVFGVLDVDAPIYKRFDANTIQLIKEISQLISKYYII